ncbi:MAG TPA: hypothetical protein VM680_12150, partial [Verrucomicrobiae bacterium]|nr:hypothetical protein [Verrucomicrobiae bacterium]
MQTLKKSTISSAVALLTVSAIGYFSLPDAQAQSGRTPWRNLSPAQLTGVHWQWILGSQVSTSAVFDDTGVFAFNNQPYFTAPGGPGQLLFLGGTFSVNQVANGDILGEAERTITIKQGTSLFFPLIDGEWDNLLQTPHWGGKILGHATGVPTLKEIVSVSPNNAVGLFSSLNGVSIPYSRLKSGPFVYTLPATDNLLQASGIDVTGTVAPAVSDGYWSFIP